MKHILSQEKSMLVKFLCLFVLCLSFSAIAGETSAPEAIEGGPIIFYSHGKTVWKTYYAAGEAVKAGYTGVMRLKEGFRSWEENGFEAVSGPETR